MLTARELYRVAATILGGDPDALTDRTRDHNTIRARMAVAWVLRHRRSPPPSYPVIGKLLERDHSSVIHLVRRADGLRVRDPAFLSLTDRLAVLASQDDAGSILRELGETLCS